MRQYSLIACLVLSTLLCIGCSDDGDEATARVVSLETSDSTIAVGEGSVIRIDLSYSSGPVFNDGANIVVAVMLPAELSYRDGTAEIDGLSSDEEVGAQITGCPSGETYLVFDLDEHDLDNAENPSGGADARLTLTVDAVAATNAAVIEARADGESIFFTCGEEFHEDESDSIRIFDAE